jgi:hypothetical protein
MLAISVSWEERQEDNGSRPAQAKMLETVFQKTFRA